MKKRDLIKKIKECGFEFEREGGSHEIYSNGELEVSVPRHTDINEITARQIVKKCEKEQKKY